MLSTHKLCNENLVLLALRELDEPERAAMKQHLRNCGKCSRELQELQGALGLYAMTVFGPLPRPEARHHLIAAIAKEPRRKKRCR
jgi:hypothetical protein